MYNKEHIAAYGGMCEFYWLRIDSFKLVIRSRSIEFSARTHPINLIRIETLVFPKKTENIRAASEQVGLDIDGDEWDFINP